MTGGREPGRRAGRRGPLPARATDRTEDVIAWLLTTAAAAVVLLAVGVAQFGYAHVLDRARAESALRAPTRAQLLEDADGSVADASGRPRSVLAHWVAPDGHETEGRLVVGTRHAEGDSLSIWTDGGGRAVPPPLPAASAVVVAWMWGVSVVLAGWALLALLWTAVRAGTARRNAASWGREWANVEPTWSGRVP